VKDKEARKIAAFIVEKEKKETVALLVSRTDEMLKETIKKILKALNKKEREDEKPLTWKIPTWRKNIHRMKKKPSNGWRERKITKERDTCFKCGKKGHKVIECGKFQCYNCGKQGHLARDCKVRLRSN